MEPRSPPLPFTASTRTGSPVNGSGNSIFELVLPPPKLVIRKSAPSRLERYRKRANWFPDSCSAFPSSHRSFKRVVSLISGIHDLAILFEAFGVAQPFVSVQRLEDLGGK